jgi:DNA-binding MarR family transcriptional regulator
MHATQVRESSFIAYDQLKFSGDLNHLQSQIVDLIKRHPSLDFSRKEISRATGLEINTVTGRVNELLESGVLVESRRRNCHVTGRSIRPVTLAEYDASVDKK